MLKGTNKLFKYVMSKHADAFFQNGSIRIGTLHEYRDIEKHGSIIGDHQEGVLREEELYENKLIKSELDVPSFVHGRIKVHPGSTLQLINSKIAVTEQSPDYYMYCVTTKFDHGVMKEFGCDKCIEIKNVKKFIEGLCFCMSNKGKFIGAFNCIYTDKVVSPGKKPPYHPALVKDPKYDNQKEVRFLWEPMNKNPQPILMACRRIPKYCDYANSA
ncbi:MAG: hypothetical protein ACUZ8N_08800 [Candidatus Scalindua sp.]